MQNQPRGLAALSVSGCPPPGPPGMCPPLGCAAQSLATPPLGPSAHLHESYTHGPSCLITWQLSGLPLLFSSLKQDLPHQILKLYLTW